MLHLPDVTLVCCYNFAHELHGMAVNECLHRATFGGVKLFSDEFGNLPRDMDFAEFVNYEVPKRVKTSHLLFIQWDSWILNPSAWTNEFLDYDYIGAPWWYNDEYNVGNSGFSLRSKRLMEFLSEHREEFPIGQPEDHVLCREYQKKLPQFKWAPALLAWHFAFERTAVYPLEQIFGFHGLFNFPYVMNPEGLGERLDLAAQDPWITNKPEWNELMQRNFPDGISR